ncbi:hypothetical protein CBR_g40658 [Chara braunii]|uniref:Uncharacterized protein n=1 Tax=Chara braunii TaxID=69332 RepID=A0A388LU47_CHABU|nr:hypothetical protein CBR_g40658 [Chara braunii]|eukprot:GBG85848.1 hypothetical protein CBR_g40658 [Chara braunii]
MDQRSGETDEAYQARMLTWSTETKRRADDAATAAKKKAEDAEKARLLAIEQQRQQDEEAARAADEERSQRREKIFGRERALLTMAAEWRTKAENGKMEESENKIALLLSHLTDLLTTCIAQQDIHSLDDMVQQHKRAVDSRLQQLEQTIAAPVASSSNTSDRLEALEIDVGSLKDGVQLQHTATQQLEHHICAAAANPSSGQRESTPKFDGQEIFCDSTKTEPIPWFHKFELTLQLHLVGEYKHHAYLYSRSGGACQAWMDNLLSKYGVVAAELHTKISWDDLKAAWHKRFQVESSEIKAMDKLMVFEQGTLPSTDWIAEYQRLTSVPDIQMGFKAIRHYFISRSCPTLSNALTHVEDTLTTTAELFDKAAQIIVTNKEAKNLRSSAADLSRDQHRPKVVVVAAATPFDQISEAVSANEGDRLAVAREGGRPGKGRGRGKAKTNTASSPGPDATAPTPWAHISSATSAVPRHSAKSECQISSARSAVPGHIATSDIVPRQQCDVRHNATSAVTSDTVPRQQYHVRHSATSAVPHQQCHVSNMTGLPGQLANETIVAYKQRCLAQIEAEEQRLLAVEAARVQAEEAASAEKLRLQADADADSQARRKEAQDLLQWHEATSIDRLKFWHFEPNGDEATTEEQHKEFLSKLVTRLLYAFNYQRSELERQYQDLTQQHQELATLRRTVQSHEDATRALNARLLDLEQAVPGPTAGASSSAPSSRQLEERVDHILAMLGDINTFAAPSTISTQLHTLKTEVQQLQSTNADGNQKMPTFQLEKFDDYTQQDPTLWWEAFTTQLRILSVAKHKYIGALFLNSKGGCQTWLTHLATSHGVDVPDLKDKITWEELTWLWKKRFIVDDAPTLAINRLFTMSQGNTATRDWLTEWQKIAPVPNLDLPFTHLRHEFYNRSCAALSQALGDREQCATFAEIIDKAREIIKTNRSTAHEKLTSWQPTYVEKVRTGPRQQHFAAVQQDNGDYPAATPASSDGDQVAAVQPRSTNKSRNNGKAKSASQAGNGQP